ncbi:MAG: hypothetical protein ACYCTH_00640 [Cellulomonas sp.]
MDEDPKGKSWDAYRAGWQPISNAHDIPPARLQTVAADQIPVRARIEWMRDGTEFVDTVAYGWTSRLVLVRVRDHRSRIGGIWLDAGDVTRT